MAGEGVVEEEFFEGVDGGEFLLVEGFESLRFEPHGVQSGGDAPLLMWRWLQLRKVFDLLTTDVRHTDAALHAEAVQREYHTSAEIDKEPVVEL